MVTGYVAHLLITFFSLSLQNFYSPRMTEKRSETEINIILNNRQKKKTIKKKIKRIAMERKGAPEN